MFGMGRYGESGLLEKASLGESRLSYAGFYVGFVVGLFVDLEIMLALVVADQMLRSLDLSTSCTKLPHHSTSLLDVSN